MSTEAEQKVPAEINENRAEDKIWHPCEVQHFADDAYPTSTFYDVFGWTFSDRTRTPKLRLEGKTYICNLTQSYLPRLEVLGEQKNKVT
jgi:hypothetical protein